MKKYSYIFWIIGLLYLTSTMRLSAQFIQSSPTIPVLNIEVLSVDKPLFALGSPGFESIKYGIEGGRMHRIGRKYHYITTEMIDDPHAVKTRIAHWQSKDGLNWKRVFTLFESDADTTGVSQRAALWGPMSVFVEEENRWQLFYVAYKSEHNEGHSWKLNKHGVIVQAVSQVAGKKGIGGPYKDRNVVLRHDNNPDPWEGQQGAAAFFPYKIDSKWYAFYGSSRSQHMPTCKWLIGMAEAPGINGPWRRMTERNPTDSTAFAENPIVYRLEKDLYLTIVDGGPFVNQIGYLTSADGLNWSRVHHINLESVTQKWWKYLRTPVGLFKEKDGTYTLYFTCFLDYPGKPDHYFGTLSRATLRINRY